MMSLSVAMALSGLDAEHWTGELKDIYYHGIALIDDKNISPTSSVATVSTEESGIDSISPNSQYYDTLYPRYSCPSVDVIVNGYKNLQSCDNALKLTNEKKKTEEKKIVIADMKIINQNRNILDLGANLYNSWKPQYAILAGGVTCFFENRSQHSRLNDVEAPPHFTVVCNDLDCQFKEPHYI